MDKGNSKFDFDNDPEFNENFYKNIERALGDLGSKQEPEKDNIVNAEEKTEEDFDIMTVKTARESIADLEKTSKTDPAKKTAEVGKETKKKFKEEKGCISERESTEEIKNANEKIVASRKESTSMKDSTSIKDSSDAMNNKSLKESSSAKESASTKDTLTEKENKTIKKDKLDTVQAASADTFTAYLSYPQDSRKASAEDGFSELASTSTVIIEDEDIIEDQLTDINSALAKQISDEMNTQASEMEKQQKKHLFFRIQSGALLTILCLTGFAFFLFFTNPGNNILIGMGLNIGGTIWDSMTNEFDESIPVAAADIDHIDQEDLNSKAPEVDTSKIVWPDHPGEGRQEEGVYNILLLGEEQIGMGEGRGRTDVIVIATMNTNNKTIKLTSLMRDMLVKIPGFKENKLNTAYEEGGLNLLYETIAQNLDIRLDGCVMVNFDHFAKIIDEIGGLDLTLTPGEAKYLNTTNYISNRAFRHVVAGTQHMNGTQVLGYSRVRKTSTITGKNNDYGRTDRHRIVLNAIFEKCKSKSKPELAAMIFQFIPMITTDIDNQTFQMLLDQFLETGMNTQKIQQLRIPVDGAFDGDARVRGMAVLIPDFNKNIIALHNFIFGNALTSNIQSVSGSAISGSN